MTKQSTLKKLFISVFVSAVVLLATLIPSFFSKGDGIKAGAEELSPDTNYWFEKIQVEIDVNEDKTFAVKESFKVGFRKSGINTGFIRDIQRISQTTRIVNGEKKSGKQYLAGLSNVEVTIDGGNAKVTESYYDAGQFFSVKMQKPDESYFDATDTKNKTGFHDFVLSYVYDMSDDKISGYDDFTFDVLGYEMALTNHFSATVKFPKDSDPASVSVRTNEKEAWAPDENKGEEFRVEGNTVTLTARPYAKERGYTVQVLLPEGYFQTEVTHFWYYWTFAIPSLAIMIFGFAVAVKYFPRKAVEPVEVVPPKNISLMRASALLYGEARTKDVPALILQWTAKGYVTLEQDGKRDVIIRKVIDLPAKEGNKKTQYFNALFTAESGDPCESVSTKELRKRRTRGAETKKWKLARSANALTIDADDPDPIYKGRSLATVLLFFSSILPVLLMLIYDMILMRFASPLFFYVFFVAATAINYPNKSGLSFVIPLIFLCTFPVPLLSWLLLNTLMLYDYACLYIVSVVWWAVAYILHFFMTRRSPEANADLGRLKGFKRFLLTAELPRIQLLLDENPEWFSTVIPYCFVMGISKKVEKRYRVLGIAVPEWVNGGSISSIGRCLSHGVGSCGGGGSGGHGGGGGGSGGSSGGGGGGGGSRGC